MLTDTVLAALPDQIKKAVRAVLRIEQRNAIAALHDNAHITRAELTIYARASERYFEDLASEGRGPPFHKNDGGRGVFYIMGEVRGWERETRRDTVNRKSCRRVPRRLILGPGSGASLIIAAKRAWEKS